MGSLLSIDPFWVNEQLWPHVKIYDKQYAIQESLEENVETVVPAGNQLGKDFIAGLVAVNTFFRCWRLGITCRIVTTSVAEHHLKVLWGEIGRFVTTSRWPLLKSLAERDKERKVINCPFVMNYQELRRSEEADSKNPMNYLVGRVSAKGEGMAGHHAEYTLAIIDEASGVDEEVFRQVRTWRKRLLVFGNCNPVHVNHPFRKAVREGDLAA